jgi:two-component system chemotaxis sensor kinase CheA
LEQAPGGQAFGFYIAVVESDGCRFGLVVDDLMAPEEIVVKPLSEVLREIGVFSGATVLGNGMLAMILDIAATGARAGVRPVAEPARMAVAEASAAQDMAAGATEGSMVIYEVRSGERMALPLSAVERIETVPLDKVEYAGGRPLLQYRGELLPLDDEGGLLRIQDSVAMDAATVLICLRPGASGTRRVGMVVRQVLDVSQGMLLAEDADVCHGQLAMVKQLVTAVHREFAGPASILQEVA